ncbi:MAG: MFS transporter [Chloroflexi bacterium]|nr:MFS transporter [Chloroflexota bacterium]
MKLRTQLTVFTIVRTVFNTAHRMMYPFLGVFARGLGVDITTFSLVVSSRSFIGMFAPFVSSISDQRGRKFGMLAGITIFTLAVGLVAVAPSFITLSIALVFGLIGKFLFDPAMQAYLGDRVPYNRRGLALSVTEIGWSLAFIGGIPLMGLLIAKFGWSAPFPLLAVLGVGLFIVICKMIPREDPHHEPADGPWANFRTVLTHKSALAGISVALWASAANEMVNLIFGVWLEDRFALKIAALGAASAVIGISELGGEGLVALFTDRLGKPRALALGLTASAISSLALPFLGRTEVGALIGLFFFYITFEFVMVSHVPMMTEVLPGARATVMSFNITGHSIGRGIGALLATFVYHSFGFPVVAGLAMFFNLIGLLALRRMSK